MLLPPLHGEAICAMSAPICAGAHGSVHAAFFQAGREKGSRPS
jgi:hypothetical protein